MASHEPDLVADDLLLDAHHRAARYLGELSTRAVVPTTRALAGLAEIDTPLPASGADPADTIAVLDRVGSPATVASAGGRYFGFVTGGALPVTVAASRLARAWDQNGALDVMSPAVAAFDRVALAWTAEVLGLPAEVGGSFVTGATMANVAGLLAARNSVLAAAGWDVDGDGLTGAPPVRVLVGEGAHSSLFKALSMVGLGRNNVEVMAMDGQGAVRADALPSLDARPTIVALQAGNVNTGASDPFDALVDPARDAGAWVHVDGAFGLWAAASERRRALVHGVDRADSWATDAHKWLNVPYDCGAIFVREPRQLEAAFAQPAAYLRSDAAHDPMATSPESSQRARGVEVWAALHHLGRDGVGALVDRCCDLAVRAGAALVAGGLEVCNDVVLNQVVFRAASDDATVELLAAVQADGRTWCGPTRWAGREAIRFSVSSWATTESDIDVAVGAIVELATTD